MAEWQPIETCPDDGQAILVVGGRYNQAIIREADGGWFRMAQHDGLQSTPTHWMPLPAPPETTL